MDARVFSLDAYDQEILPFLWWVKQVPGRMEQVKEDVLVLQRVGHCAVSGEVVGEHVFRLACDAAFRLQMLAYEGRFDGVEMVFATYYHLYARVLLSFYREVS